MKRLYSLISVLAVIILLFSGCAGTGSDVKQESSAFLEAEAQQDEEYFFSDANGSNITVNKANSASEESEPAETVTTSETTTETTTETTKAPETATTAAPETTVKPTAAAAEKTTAETKKPSASKTTAATEKKTEKETSGKTETTKKVKTEKQSTTAKSVKQNDKSDMVWIPNSGAKYHKSASCSGMKNPSHVSLSTAKARGYTPCKKCYG